MKKLNRLPEYIEHCGFALCYIGSERVELSEDTWLRHVYKYMFCDLREVFREMVGESGSLNLDGRVTVISKEKAESMPPYLYLPNERKTPVGTRRARVTLDSDAVSQKMRDVLSYLDQRRKKRDERRKAKETQKTQIDLSRRIRGQVKPFGGE